MKPQRLLTSLVLLATLLAALAGLSQAQAPKPEDAAAPAEAAAAPAAIGTAFTYQGQLKSGSNPASGAYDFQFILYNASSGGSQVGSIVTRSYVPVTNGLFTVALDFGAVFDGTRLWLEIAVRPSGSTGYTILSPRQELTPAPYAIQANRALALSAPDGDPRDAVYVDNAGNVGIGTSSPEARLHVNGNAKVTGNLSWTGHLSNFTLYGEFQKTARDGQSWTYMNLVSSAYAICFLTEVVIEDTDDTDEMAGCNILNSGGMWQLGALANGDSTAICAARCLGW